MVAIVVSACAGDEPASVSERATKSQQASEPSVRREAQEQSSQQASAASEVSGGSLDSRTAPAAQDERAEVSVEAESAPVSEQKSNDAAVEAEEVEAEEPEPSAPPRDLTEVPGVVVEDADVRVRPGLAWGVIDRLESGVSVTALQQAGGWYRVRHGAERVGWVRTTMLDLGEVEAEQVQEQSAPPLFAEWRGAKYGVMGQSADGAEVRLLENVEASPMLISAPIGDVTLLADDVTLEDLPILIGEETVVFPADDFRVGQGKILPKANEWMWLPWGWLLAHNDTHIWQWRPETDELEFVERPPGFARLSPDGRYLAIDRLCDRPAVQCDYEPYAIILPLDGSARISALALLSRRGLKLEPTRPGNGLLFLDWAPNGKAVSFYANVWDGQEAPATSLVVHVDGQLVLFDETGSLVFGDRDCQTSVGFPSSPGGFNYSWRIRADNTIAADGGCVEDNVEEEWGTLVFSLGGEFLGVDEYPWWRERDHDSDLVRSTTGGDALSDELLLGWSPNDRYALVVDLVAANVWIYDAGRHELDPVQLGANGSPQARLWGVLETLGEFRHFNLLPSWHEDEVAAVIISGSVARSVLLVDATTSAGTVLDLGGAALYRDLQVAQGWNPSGTAYHILFGPFVRGDGLAIEAPRIFSLLTVDRTGSLTGTLNVASTCGDSVLSGELRYRAGWSPNGKLFAVGGQDLDGIFACPE
ncbi:MAG: SH3 domain-containing protein [Chloroflexi bacterium]|nr:SH3 domain-containing protein [Chloroflexota bacterium]